ncbi:MAG: Bax inhibitor-1/YccA family protein [Geminicoccaceae bacterium]|nr:Bax inhibitor-1/YccA family protein [Geminicoccaceae bacterium]MCB9942769.1 Bax inhibitor-1/YccA family protein [Geminicoccaceae bacterium]
MDLRSMTNSAPAGLSAERLDQGLRSYMLSVYNYMAIALVITGLTAFATSQSPAMLQLIFGTPLKWVVMLAPLGFVMLFSFRINKMSTGAAQLTFWGFAVVMGLSLASIFLVFTGESIARVFFISAATFGAMSLYGYTTKTDLSKFHSFLMMGLIGIIIASLVNIFIGSSAIQFAVSIIGVLVFIGLTAYDTQAIKEEYVGGLEYADGGIQTKGAIMGALRLYLDFINLFMMLLQLFGNRD